MSTNMHDLQADPSVIATASIAASLRKFAAGLVIRTEDAYRAAAERLKEIKGALAQIEDARTRITKPINDSLREVNAQARTAAEPFKADELTIKHAMLAFSDEQDRLREIEQRRANEIARKEQARLQEIADRAAAKGQENKAEQFQGRAAAVVAPVSQVAAPKVGGISIPKVWTFEITDASLIPREYLLVDETKIRKVVAALKGSTNIPGVRVTEVKRIAAGMA